jgi:hypothetical protein
MNESTPRIDKLRTLIAEALEASAARKTKIFPSKPSQYLGYVDFGDDPNDPDIHIVGYAVVKMNTLVREVSRSVKAVGDMVTTSAAQALKQLTEPNSVTISKLRALVEAQELLNSPQAKRMRTMAARRSQ